VTSPFSYRIAIDYETVTYGVAANTRYGALGNLSHREVLRMLTRTRFTAEQSGKATQMFFRRNQKTPDQAASTQSVTTELYPSAPLKTSATPLPASALRRNVDISALNIASTNDVKPLAGLIGQGRAKAALEFGVAMNAPDFNVFVLGPPASGKRYAVNALLRETSKSRSTPDDWAYVTNFDDASRPRALRLPHGRGHSFARGMSSALDYLRAAVPELFASDDYLGRRRAIDERFEAAQADALATLGVKANARNIAIVRTPQGFAVAPIHEGKVVKPETFAALPEAMRAEKEAQIVLIESELQAILQRAPAAEKDRRVKLASLHDDVAQRAVKTAFEDLAASVASLPEATAFLNAATADLIRNVAAFLPPADGGDALRMLQPSDVARDPLLRRYMINVVSSTDDADTGGAPVVDELNPSATNLIGRIEPLQHMGSQLADALVLKGGALHRANGGYLIIDARWMLDQPFAWEALKRALKSREIKMELPPGAPMNAAASMLEPAPIPLDVKVFLIGDRELYLKFSAFDPDFAGLFKVLAEFDDAIVRTDETDRAFIGVLSSITSKNGLRHVDASGIARMLEEAIRLAGDCNKVSIEVGRLADTLREADHWAGVHNHSMITRADVARSVEERLNRADRVRDATQEQFSSGQILLDTSGSKIGQINGLSVLQLGDFAFGRPARITARVRLGSGRVTDIEREATLGGPLHTKGMMILWGFLAGRYAQDVPLALAASIVFEQSYGGVDGDSASSAELYALLSALAEAPLNQALAITGSVNQLGQIQPIGGVNEKIEGYFDICKARGLTGEHGVMIPATNVNQLMLRGDIVTAADAGQFHIYPIHTIDEGLELLTGIDAGVASVAGHFPPDTINGRVEARLRRFAERARDYGQVALRPEASEDGAAG
jgi:predicted ATP-dependent protease